MTPRSVSIVTLGCAKNQVDSEFLATSLQSSDLQIAHSEDFAEVVMINTCGFILDAKEQSVDTILEYAAAKKRGQIKTLIVFGCMVERYRDELKQEIPEVDFWSGVKDFQQIIRFLNSQNPLSRQRDFSLLSTPRHYAFLKISEGCDRQCSFCAIPLIRGKHISVPVEEILNDAVRLVEQGVKELIVIAQDTTYYGLDLYGKRMLPHLLDRLARESGAAWIRLHYAYPAGFPFELIEVMAKHDNICKYIDIPFQHADNTILHQMKRFHTVEDIEHLIAAFRKSIPDIHIRSTFITGFPGESKSAFNTLVQFLETKKLGRVGFFTYSEEAGTPAALMDDDISANMKAQRLQKLIEVQERISFEHNKNNVGKCMKIIVDEVSEKYLLGRTEFDSPEIDQVVVIQLKQSSDVKTGDFIQVRITSAGAFELTGEMI
jgi:ribosomal protein S12 methylthiotransferase